MFLHWKLNSFLVDFKIISHGLALEISLRKRMHLLLLLYFQSLFLGGLSVRQMRLVKLLIYSLPFSLFLPFLPSILLGKYIFYYS